MNKLNKVAALFAIAALAGSAIAQTAPTEINNWRATDGTVWKNGTNEYCWRDNFFTPETGVQGCACRPSSACACCASTCSRSCCARTCSSPSGRGTCHRKGELRC